MIRAPQRAPGRASRAAILDRGLRLAAQGGLRHASIGALASALGMSKSAVFAHFGSKPELDVALVDAAAARFERQVVAPTAAAPTGVARLVALSEAWLAMAATGDAAIEVLISCPQSMPAPRAATLAWQRRWRAVLVEQARAAVANGEFPLTTPDHVVGFELDALLHAAYRDLADGDAAAVERARYAIEHLMRRWSLAGPPPEPPR